MPRSGGGTARYGRIHRPHLPAATAPGRARCGCSPGRNRRALVRRFTARVGRLGVAQMSFRDARSGEPRGAVWRLRLAPRVCCPTGGGCVADLPAPMHPDHVLVPRCERASAGPGGPTALTLVPPQWPSASRYARPARRAQQREYRSLETSSPGLMRPRWEEIVAGCLLPAFARHVRPAEAGPCGHRSPPRPRAPCSGPLARAPGTTPAPDRSAAGHGRAHLGGAPASAPARQRSGPSDGSRALSRSRRRPGPRAG